MTPGHRRETEAAGGALGAAAGQGAYQAAGYQTKHFVDARTRRGGKGVTPQQVRMQDTVLKPLKKEFGMGLPKGSPGRNNVGYHRSYPKTLPYGKVIRTLGHTHEGRKGVAIGAAATLAGAGLGLASAHRIAESKGKSVRKSAFGVEDERLVSKSAQRPTGTQQAGSMLATGGAGALLVGAGNMVDGHLVKDSARRVERAHVKNALLHRVWDHGLAVKTDKVMGAAARQINVGRAVAAGGAVALGAGAVLASHKSRKPKENPVVSKSAFGVEDERLIEKSLGRHSYSATSEDKVKQARSTIRPRTWTGAGIGAVAGAPFAGVGAIPGAVIGGAVGHALGNRKAWKRGQLERHDTSGLVAHVNGPGKAHESKGKSVVTKSAFGVEDDRIEKGLSVGGVARGAKFGAKTVETNARVAGAVAAPKVKAALKPVTSFVRANAKPIGIGTGAVAAGGGVGAYAGSRKKNNGIG